MPKIDKDLCNGLTNDEEILKTAICEIMESMSVEQLRKLYITAKVWDTANKKAE